jgi:hypothetical protein
MKGSPIADLIVKAIQKGATDEELDVLFAAYALEYKYANHKKEKSNA